MPELLLTNPDQFPDDHLLEDVLGNRYQIYNSIKNSVNKINSDLTFNWKYYKDGKSWLCKVVFKKSTILWLSIWDESIKVTFYFSGKKKDAFLDSNIKDIYKTKLSESKTSGKLSPLTFEFTEVQDMTDFAAVAALKIKLK